MILLLLLSYGATCSIFHSENVTRGAYLQHAAILDLSSKKMLQHLCRQIKSV